MRTCEKCGRTMDEVNFYTYKDGEKMEICKKCITMHVDNFNDETYKWILEKVDVPYIPVEWNVLRDKAYAKNPMKMNGMSVIGKYLSKMKLRQWKDYGWKDSEKLQQDYLEKQQAKEAHELEQDRIMQIKLAAGEITESQYKTMTSTKGQFDQIAMAPPTAMTSSMGNPYQVDNFMSNDDMPDLTAELTDEDKKYLAMKWGNLYQPREWIELEKSYNEMMNSFDIQDADTTNTLLFVCKTNLKMNQALDLGDIDSFQKLSKVYNDLRKSAKFTAAQNKEKKEDFVDCVGEMVAYCEKERRSYS